METKTWILVADQSQARVFEKGKRNPLHPVKEFSNPKGKMKPSELGSDRPGRSFDSFSQAHHGQTGGARHAYSSEVGPHEKLVEAFVGKVSAALEKARQKKEFEKLVLVADPKLLGLLRKHLDPNTLKAVTETHSLDFSWLKESELLERLAKLNEKIR